MMYGIAFNEYGLKPTGGPAGYLFNLKYGLDSIGCNDVKFLSCKERPFIPKGIVQKVPTRIREFNRLRYWSSLLGTTAELPESFLKYETIHFHSTVDLYRHRHQLDNYGGKVLLTSHAPCASHLEVLAQLNNKDIARNRRFVDELVEADRFAFTRANYVIFPCEEAEECYFNTWDEYKKVRQPEKIRYLPTGLKSVDAVRSRDEVCRAYGIPSDAFIVSYVGRHNQIKGYDRICELASHLQASTNVWFLVAGKEEPMEKPDFPNWVEVGWTNDPYSIIAASDVFLLPNRETYFDLVLLEVLCLGVPVIASYTGGNKYFKQYADEERAAIMFFQTPEELAADLSLMVDSPEEERQKGRERNKVFFKENFSAEVFAKAYISLVGSIAAGV